ncbi:MAG: histidine--tRNA ligase [Gaiellales bacterium]|mgnify:CR=1 FL=1|nr:histidine--tRNA ligase [Gaiellales bacterium]
MGDARRAAGPRIEPVVAPKGTYDILPEDQPQRTWLLERAASVFARYGYGRLDTPLFEETRLFSRGVGESTDIVRKEMYTFEDNGGRSMTLRPEGTAPAARAFVEHGMHTRPLPVKVWYYWPMFRYEAPQSGRYRQHFQLGVEALGSHSPVLDAEVIGVLHALYKEIGLMRVELRFNSMGCRACRRPYTDRLRSFLQAHQGDLCDECRERMDLNPLRSFDCKVPYCREVMDSAPRLADFLCEECAEHHHTVKRHLELQGVEFVEDHRLVRGMDYYTRTTFEFQAANLGAQSGVGGGGRYDNLVEAIGGPPTPGVGWGSGVERILLALNRGGAPEVRSRAPAAYLVAVSAPARETAFGLAHDLRARGVTVDLDFMMRSMKGQMKQAGRSGAAFALIVGDEELQAGQVTLRYLAEAREERLAAEAAVNTIVQWEESRG